MKTERRLTSIVPCLVAGLLATGGCTYHAEEVNAFLQEPRSPVSGTEYRLLPPDVILVRSQHVPEINNIRQQVRPDGKINLPLLGEISVADRTPKQVEGLLTAAARDYYQQTDATVEVVGYNSQKFYVFGQVRAPGPLPWTGRDTLLDALARAQPTTLAWPERIIVVRGSQPQDGGYATSQPSKKYTWTGVHPPAADKPRHRMLINLMAIVKSGDMANNVLLKPNDIIYVQPNPLAAIGLAIQQCLFPIRPGVEAITVPAAAGAPY